MAHFSRAIRFYIEGVLHRFCCRKSSYLQTTTCVRLPDFFGHVGGSLGMAQVGVEEPGWYLGPYPTIRSNPMWVNHHRAKDTISGLPSKKPKAARRPDRT